MATWADVQALRDYGRELERASAAAREIAEDLVRNVEAARWVSDHAERFRAAERERLRRLLRLVERLAAGSATLKVMADRLEAELRRIEAVERQVRDAIAALLSAGKQVLQDLPPLPPPGAPEWDDMLRQVRSLS